MPHPDQNQQVQLQIPADLDCVYRDFFTIFAGPDDVILEFGNVNRSVANQVKIADRIAMTPANALRLREALDRTILEMQRRVSASRTAQDAGFNGGTA
ncbi:MAG: hypothetical protein HY795_14845 [Desulfovibrio sp.]|nr:hypothetical protein [Desulfovibrio sp.]MBI4960372.1 hypothetical protein [Desulfovibrio sp.]